MEYTLSSIISLISHLHAATADFTNQKLAQSRLVSSHGFILYLLSTEERLTKGELAARINRDKSTTTVLVRRLLEEGLVREETSPQDSRRKLLSLTEKGRQLNGLTAAISRDLLDACWKGFSPEEKDALLALLVKMNRNVEDALHCACAGAGPAGSLSA